MIRPRSQRLTVASRRFATVVLVTCCVLYGMLGLVVSPGVAATGYSFAPPAFGSFSSPQGVAVDQATGNVFVADGGGINAVDVFGSEGGPPAGGGPSALTGVATPAGSFSFGAEPTGVAVDNSGGPSDGDVYVADVLHNVVDKFKLNGSLEYEYISQLTGFREPLDVSTDGQGDVYVADYGGRAVAEFSPAGVPIGTFTSPNVNHPQSVAVDATGDIYVMAYSADNVVELKRNSTVSGIVVSEVSVVKGATGVTFDRASNRLFVDLGSQVNEYDDEGHLLTQFASETLGGSLGLAVREASGEVYASDGASGKVDAFVPFNGPSVTTGAASQITPTTAAVEGTVDPEGLTIINCVFKYGAGQTAPCNLSGAEIGTGNTPVNVFADLAGLEPATSYPYQIVLETEGHEEKGAKLQFDTRPVATATTETVSAVTAETATLNGNVDLLAGAAGYYFEYYEEGQEEPYLRTEEQPLVSGEQTVDASVANLAPNKLYHARLVVVPSWPNTPPIEGALQEFETVAAPLITGTTALNPQGHEVSVAGEVNPENSETTYVFEYADAASLAETHAYGHSTVSSTITAEQAGVAPLPTGPIALSELKAATVYHYRLVATNVGGTTRGPDQTFSTTSATPPAVEGESSSGIGQTTATISGAVNPNGLTTSYAVEVGIEVAPGVISYTPSYGSAGAGTEAVAITLPLSGLLPGSAYHFRIVATNVDGTTAGADTTFTTVGLPASIAAPPPVVMIPFTAPIEPSPGKSTNAPTRAQKLAKALRACNKLRSKRKRAACDRTARQRFGPTRKARGQ